MASAVRVTTATISFDDRIKHGIHGGTKYDSDPPVYTNVTIRQLMADHGFCIVCAPDVQKHGVVWWFRKE